MMIMRKVAMAASCGFIKSNDFNDFWPLPDQVGKEKNVKVWGSKEKADEFRKQIEKAHGIKLTHE